MTPTNPAADRSPIKRFGPWVVGVFVVLAAIRPVENFFFAKNKVLESEVNPVITSQMGFEAPQNMKMVRMKLMPFTGYHAVANFEEEGDYSGVHFKLKTNSLGFLTPYEFDGLKEAPFKGHGATKVVLVAGGSAAWGVGASSNDKIFSYVLEHLLNKADPNHNWKVVNLAMAGWDAFQEFVALDLYGAAFDPDWVVTFDGRNDVVVGTLHGEPVPSYFFYTGQRRLNDMFESEFSEPWYYGVLPFFRYRRFLDGLSIIARTPQVVLDESRQLALLRYYYSSLESIIARFPNSKLLLATQPTSSARKGAYQKIGGKIVGHPVLLAYMDIVPAVAHIAKSHPNTYYLDANALFSERSDVNTAKDGWMKYFVDDCHLRDSGHAVVAERLAQIILRNSSK